MTTYYFAMASKRFLIEEEPVEEILRERFNFYKAQHKELDFWLVQDSNFFHEYNLNTRNMLPAGSLAAVISTNEVFINWLKLRLQYVDTGSIQIHDSGVVHKFSSKVL